MTWTPHTDPSRSWSYTQAAAAERSEPLGALGRLVVALLSLLMIAGAIVWLVTAGFAVADFVKPSCDSGVCGLRPVDEHLLVYGQALLAMIGASGALRVTHRGYTLLRGDGHASALLRTLLATLIILSAWAAIYTSLPAS